MIDFKEELITANKEYLVLIDKHIKLSKQYMSMLFIIKELDDKYPQFLYEITSRETIMEIVKGEFEE